MVALSLEVMRSGMTSRLRTIATIALAAVFASSMSSAQAPSKPAIYKDPRQPIERRVEDILSRMTLDEKVAQLETVWESKAKLQTNDGRFSPERASRNFPNGIGGFARPSDKRGV